MNELQIFNNSEFGELEIVLIEGKIYFKATEVAEMLGYKNPRDAILRHCKGVVKHDVIENSGFGARKVKINLINEGDVLRLIIGSELDGADKIESWIFDEVIPQIMKTGSYSIPVPMTVEDMIIMQANEMKAVKGDVAVLKHKVENQITLDHGKQMRMQKAIRTRVYQRNEETGVPKEKLFSALHRTLWDTFDVPSYKDIKTKDYNNALNLINTWIEKAEIRNNSQEEIHGQ